MRTRERFFGGAKAKLNRLELGPTLAEVEQRLQKCVVLLTERDRKSNLVEFKRKLDDVIVIEEAKGGKWIKTRAVSNVELRVEFRIRISSRREILYKDALHLRRRTESGDIDLGVIIVPSDNLRRCLPDRTPSSNYAARAISEMGADCSPIILIEIEHHGPGPAPTKRKTDLA